MKYKCFRIIEDTWAGFEVQVWRLWFPFWVERSDYGLWRCNTFSNIEDAKEWISKGCPKKSKDPDTNVLYKSCKKL